MGAGERTGARAVALRTRRLRLVDPRDLAGSRDAEREARGPAAAVASNHELVDLERDVHVMRGRRSACFEPRQDAANVGAP